MTVRKVSELLPPCSDVMLTCAKKTLAMVRRLCRIAQSSTVFPKRRNSDAFWVTASRWCFGSTAAILGGKFQLDDVTDIQK